MSDFHTQGAVPIDSPAYVSRAFEEAVANTLLNDRWVLLLGPREHGKTSGLARIKARLREQGLSVVFLDLQRLGPCPTLEHLLRWTTNKFADDLGVGRPNADLPGEDLFTMLGTLDLTQSGRIVVVIDEAASIEDDSIRNAFYGQIRSISTVRAEAETGSLPRRLSFLFAGMFRPDTLVLQDNSPFNVCERIETGDLTVEDTARLARTVLESREPKLNEGERNAVVSRAYDVVGGQPYLLQAIFSRVFAPEAPHDGDAVREAIDYLRHSDSHGRALMKRVFAEPGVREIAVRLTEANEEEGILAIPGDADQAHAQVIGLVKREGGTVYFRNALYAEFARSSPQLRPREVVAEVATTISPMDTSRFSFLPDEPYRRFADESQRGAAKAFEAGSYRLTLIAYGSATEALLIAWLLTVNPANLTTAATDSSVHWSRNENASSPTTWRLVNLIKVAQKLAGLARDVDPPDALRRLRNDVHPAASVARGLSEEELKPEAIAASGFFEIVLRDIERACS